MGEATGSLVPDHIIDDLQTIREPGVFIVDDVAFIQDKHGYAVGEAIARKNIRKQYYLETRGGRAAASQGAVQVLEAAWA